MLAATLAVGVSVRILQPVHNMVTSLGSAHAAFWKHVVVGLLPVGDHVQHCKLAKQI